MQSTLLVINYKYKSLDKRKKIYKSFDENAIVFESNKLYEDKIPDWISKRLAVKNIKIEPKAALMLTEFLGNELSKINNELEKLIITLPENSRNITPELVSRNIGISKEYNIYELQNALTRKDILKANRIIHYFAENQKNNHISVTISSLYFYFSKILLYHSLQDKSRQKVAASLKINPYFIAEYETAARNYPARKVVQIISFLRDYDLRSKGYGNVSTPAGGLLKELIYKIIH